MIDIIGQPGRPATKEEIEAYKRDYNGCFGAAGGDGQRRLEKNEGEKGEHGTEKEMVRDDG